MASWGMGGMARRAPAIRAVRSSDTAPELHLGNLLQRLIAAGDEDWVEGITDLVRHRVAWVLERDGVKPTPIKIQPKS